MSFYIPDSGRLSHIEGSINHRRGALMADLVRQLRDYRLTTAEIHYHLPDHPSLLQSYTWQDYDLAPEYPALCRFLDC